MISQGAKAIVDWLRLFDVTSFYVTLIIQTILDMKYFLLILAVMVIYFGSTMYMLQLNVITSDGTDIVEQRFDNFMLDSVLNQYLLMLGEFNLDGFLSHVNPGLCYGLFFFSTIMLQITFLNMLIAIMGDTFDKVIEQRPTYSLK